MRLTSFSCLPHKATKSLSSKQHSLSGYSFEEETMKLRIRSLETKETLKINIQSPSPSLHDLKIAIADKISASSDNIHLSLNRKDKIDAAPQHSLQSIGIASGDLIFYTQNPNGFVSGEQSQPLIQFPISQQPQVEEEEQQQTLNVNNNIELHDSDMVDVNNPVDVHIEKGDSVPREETLVQEDEMMGLSEESEEDPDVVIEKFSSSSVPCFLRKVLEEEVGHNNNNNNNNTEGGDYKLLVIAVHAVFLESGFVGFDTGTQKKIHGFHLQEGWASESNNVSLRYTVSDLLNSDDGDSVETVVLKFLTYGKFVKVYGSLSRNSVQLYQLCLDKSQFVPSIDFLWMNYGSMDEKDDGSLSKSSHESKVFEFWKIAKDKLALPLLIDLCERTGLPSPPCFMRLPFDLKLRILELLPGVDIAQFGCVSSELRYLSSNNKLWRQKLVEDFPFLDVEGIVQDSWKEKYVSCQKNKANQRARQRARIRQIRRPHYPRGGEFDRLYRPREPYPIHFPGVIGGDFDRFPAPFGNHSAPFGSHRATRFPSVFRHNCNLGGHNI